MPPLAGIPGALDELHHRAGKAMRDTAHDHAEGGGGLALARAGMDDDEPLLAALLGHHAVADGLLLGHLGGVPGIFGQFLFGSHRQRSFGLTRRSSWANGGAKRWFLSYDRRRGNAIGLKDLSPKAAAPATVTGEILRLATDP